MRKCLATIGLMLLAGAIPAVAQKPVATPGDVKLIAGWYPAGASWLAANNPSSTIAIPTPPTNTTALVGWNPTAGGWYAFNTDASGNLIISSGGGFTVVGTPVANLGYVPVYTGTSNSGTWQQLTQDEILPGFAINSFACTGCTTLEIGNSSTNPSFTASYSSTPSSAAITNTAGIDSPLNLTSPYTSGTVVGTFTKTTQTNVVFTLTAVAATTKTATQTLSWYPRQFGGIGAANATSTVTASGSNAVLSTGDTLSGTAGGAGLSASPVGLTYGPYSPSNQAIYLLLTGGCGHTFTSGGFQFPMTTTAVTFTNQYGASVSACLYESTNLLSATFSILVVS